MVRTLRLHCSLLIALTLVLSVAHRVDAQTVLVPVGAQWKFLADGTDPGPEWRTRTFDDSTWAVGPAKLGYGDEDEATVVGFGPDPAAKFPTTYFRHTFNATDAATLDNFLIKLLRDDGAIVYVNGIEVFRSNMPAGEVTSTTFAFDAVADEDEAEYVSKFFTENHLVEGQNVLAVEVHQADPSSSDLGFNLEFVAHYQLAPPTVAIVAPTPEDALAEGQVDVTVSAAFVGGTVTSVELLQGDTVLGEALSPPFIVTWKDATAGSHSLTARARTDLNMENISAPVVLNVLPALIQHGATWKYLADGTNQGKLWREPAFDDSGWSEGPAELGYGDDDEATIVPSGPDSTTNYITTYFRKSFTVDNPASFNEIIGTLTYDDGAVVYLNGTEVFRINMPAGDPAFNAPATDSADYDPEDFTFSASQLRPGLNVIAVEIHQGSATSSDISFDLVLRGSR